MTSSLLIPSPVRRRMYSLVRWSQRSLTTTMRCSAALAWRSPTRQRHARGAGRRRGVPGSYSVLWRQPHPPRGTAGGTGRHPHRQDHSATGLAGGWAEQSPAPPTAQTPGPSATDAREGMLIQMDGSHHPWLGEHTLPFTLLIAVDDATGTAVSAWSVSRGTPTTISC